MSNQIFYKIKSIIAKNKKIQYMKKVIGWGLLILGALSFVLGFLADPNPNSGVMIAGLILKVAMFLAGIFLLSENEKGCWVTIIISILLILIIFFTTQYH